MPPVAQRTRLIHGNVDGSAWELAIRTPGTRVRPYICGEYVGYVERGHAPNTRREFPVPYVVMILEFGPPIAVAPNGDPRLRARHRGGFLGGLDDRYAVCDHDGFQSGIQINLTPIGARLLFGMPMSEISGRIVALSDVLPLRYRQIGERLHDLTDWDDRFELLECALIDCIERARVETRAVAWAVDRIEAAGGVLDVRALCRELGYSQKHVIALFRDRVGLAPKALSRIIRFDRLIRHLRQGGGGTWAELALEFGYYDQAHLARDVRQFTGTTPTAARPHIRDLQASLDVESSDALVRG